MGTYIIDKPDTKEVSLKTQFTGYDYMIKFNIPYKSRVTYPCKASVLLSDVCSQAGVECGSTTFVNSNYMILGNAFTNDEDCRTVLSNIAQLAGGFATIGRDNKLYIKTLKSTGDLLKVKDIQLIKVKDLIPIKALSGIYSKVDEEIDGNNYFEFNKNDKFGRVNSLVLRLSQIEGENTSRDDQKLIEQEGLTEITIEDNYFLNSEEEREKVIEPLWKVLKGLEYLPFEAKYYGYPYLDLGDAIYISDTKDKKYFTYVFNYAFEYAGDYSGTLKTEAITKTQTAYKNTNSVKKKVRKAEIQIDKINGKIQSIVAQQTETSQAISSITQTAEEISTEVSKKVGNDEIISKINQSAEEIQINADKIDIKGKAVNFTSEIGLDYTYTEEDKNKVLEISVGNIAPSGEDFEKYDVNGDGIIDSRDALRILKAVTENNGQIKGTFEIDPHSLRNTITLKDERGNITTVIGLRRIQTEKIISNIIDADDITSTLITSESVVQTSLKEKKKNFEKLKNGLDIVNNTDIYKYNLKSQNDNDKKHIGFVIGEDFKYSNEITSVDREGKEIGVDTYSMVAVAYKAIQELVAEVQTLKIEIEQLKGGQQ